MPQVGSSSTTPFVPPPLSSHEGPDPSYTSAPAAQTFTPPPVSSHEGPDPEWQTPGDIPGTEEVHDPQGTYLYTTPEGEKIYAPAGSTVFQVNAQPTQATSQYEPGAAAFFKEHPLIEKYLANPLMQTASAEQQAFANIAHLFGNVARPLDWLAAHSHPGLPSDLRTLSDYFSAKQQENEQLASRFAGNRQDIGSKIVRGAGGVVFNAPPYIAATSALGPIGGMAAMGGLENLDRGPAATVQGTLEGAGQGLAWWLMGPLGRIHRLYGAAALNYAYDKLRNPDVDDDTALVNAGVAGLTAMLPEKTPYPDWIRPGIKPNLTPEDVASNEYMERHGFNLPAPLKLGSDWMEKTAGLLQTQIGGGYYKEGVTGLQRKLLGPVQTQELARIHPEQVSPDVATTELQEQLQKNLDKTKHDIADQVHPMPRTPEEAGTAISTKLKADLDQERNAIAQQVHQAPTTPEKAAQSVLDRGNQLIRMYDEEANAGYKPAWEEAGNPQLTKRVQIRTEEKPVLDEDGKPTGEVERVPVYGDVNMPVDVRFMKDIARRELPKLRFRPASEQAQSAAVSIYQRILEGHDHVTAEQAEEALKGFKAEAREAPSPQLRNQAQGVAAGIIPELQSRIDNAVAEAGPQAVEGLRQGRASTAKKYGVLDVMRGFGKQDPNEVEPVQAFRRMTWGQDAGINHLRDVAGLAPDQMPQVGRAFIDSGGDVSQLGPETRKILFRTPEINQQLDQHHARRQMFEPLTKMEPVQLFNRLTQAGGVRNNLLRAVAAQAPEQIPQLARAFIDSDANLSKLDPESQGILFHDTPTIQALQQYYARKAQFEPLIKKEPKALFDQLTALGGARSKLLADVARETPQHIPRIARAYFQGLLERATEAMTPQKVKSTINGFLDMAPQDKAILLNRDPALISDVHNFMVSYERLARNVNPSGSGYIMAAAQLKTLLTGGLGAALGMHTGHGAVTGVMGAGALEVFGNMALSRLLFNKRATRMMTKAMREQEAGNHQGARLAVASALQAASEHQEPPEPPEEPPEGPPTGGGAPPPTAPAGGGAVARIKSILSDEEGALKPEAFTPGELKKRIKWAGAKIAQGVVDPKELKKSILENFGATPRDALNEIAGRAHDEELKKVVPWTPGIKLADIHPLTSETVPVADPAKGLMLTDVQHYLEDMSKKALGAIPKDAPDQVKAKRMLEQSRREVRDQMNQPNPGIDFYEKERLRLESLAEQIYPEFKTNPTQRILHTLLSSLLGNNQGPREESFYGTKLYDAYRAENRQQAPYTQPGRDVDWPGRGARDALTKFNRYVQLMGEDGLADFVTKPQKGTDLVKLNPELAKEFKDKDLNAYYPGSLIVGPKLGRYFNANMGIPADGTAVDVWMVRQFTRQLGDMFKKNGEEKASPTPAERQLSMDLDKVLAREFKLKNDDAAQSVRWHYEKELYRRLGSSNKTYTRSQGLERYINEVLGAK